VVVSTIFSTGLPYIWVNVMRTVVEILTERQEKVLHKVLLHSATQMAADRNILKTKQERNFNKLGNCVQD